jgi:hypothetical protein
MKFSSKQRKSSHSAKRPVVSTNIGLTKPVLKRSYSTPVHSNEVQLNQFMLTARPIERPPVAEPSSLEQLGISDELECIFSETCIACNRNGVKRNDSFDLLLAVSQME